MKVLFSTLFLFAALVSFRANATPAKLLALPTFSSAVPADVVKQTLDDLTVVQGLQGSGATPLYSKIFGSNLDGANLNNFFSTRIASFDMDDCGGGPAVAACVQPYYDPHIMWLTQNYVTYKIAQIFRIGVIFHESRHTESAGGFWSHVNCPTPFKDPQGNDIRGIISGTLLQGQPACDTKLLGAYALEAIFLKNVELYCTNCSQKVKMDAKLYGEDGVLRISDAKANADLRKDLGL
ncbi:hypothetical protein BH10BDE1_BH10BDE1_22460 [soil metagenome]